MNKVREDLFTGIHKAIRSMIYETGSILQSADFCDSHEEQATLKILCNNLKKLKSHGEHENNNIFNRLNEYEHETANIFFTEHNLIDRKYDELTALIREMLESPPEHKYDYGIKINIGFNNFAAYYLTHMNKEEEIAIPSTQKCFNDEELIEMRMNIQKSIPPDIYQEWMQYMLPAMNNSELKLLFAAIKSSTPPEVFSSLSGIAEGLIGSERWEKIVSGEMV